MKKIFCVLLLLSFTMLSDAQWQNSGTYNGNIVQFQIKDSILIAGTFGSGVYITSDGTNWIYSNNGMTIGQIISFSVIDNYIFAGAETEGVYRSADNGNNWIAVNNGLSNLAIHALSPDADNLYAATSLGINLTTNYGGTWSRISPTFVGSVIFSVIAYSGKIIAASANGVFISTNNGVEWNDISSGISGYIYCLAKFGNAIYAGSSSSGIFKTTNDGLNWAQTGIGLPPGKAVRKISFADEKIFAALYNSGGIYYLPFSASNWISANQGLPQLTCYTVIKYKDYIYAGTTTGIFRRPSAEFTSVIRLDEKIPKDFDLQQNYPNPFNPVTVIKFAVPERTFVRLTVFDMLGKETKTIINEVQNRGVYSATLDASSVPSGVYFYRLQTDKFTSTKKMVVIK